MAATPTPFVWNFNREFGSDVNAHVGGTVHYFDENAQELFLNAGLKTRTTTPVNGHWRDYALSDPSEFIDTLANTRLVLDHPSNGILYGATTDGYSLTFLRYVYSLDLSAIVDSWSWKSQSDSYVAQFSADILNIGSDFFTEETTLFQPGAKIRLRVRFGDSQPLWIGVAYLDEVNFDLTSETVDMTGRNSIGYFLKDQTFDDQNAYTGLSHVIAGTILTYAGLPNHSIQEGSGTQPFTFKPENSLLDGLQEMFSYYTTASQAWTMFETSEGCVCIGYEDWLAKIQPNTYYQFKEESDVFKRKTSKLVDGSYTSIRVTGKGANDADLAPVTIAVTNFPNWVLGTHRTKHLTAPDGMTQEKMQAWAENQANALRYVGIKEDFTSPFRPQLLVGDIAETVSDGVGTSLGIITEVEQSFSKQNGFTTNFSVDSGGISTDGANYNIYTRVANVNGYNRRQRIIDLVRLVSGK